MNKKIFFSSLLILTLSGFVLFFRAGFALAVTDSCDGVPTTFTGTVPSSVEAGKSFTVSNITTEPSTSYGVTVTSAILNMTVINASPTIYSQNDTHTDPSPTTGAPTYTAYYPNLTLTAAGSVGSQILIKLTSVVAQVTELGPTPIVCPLTATLATVTITSPAAAGGGSGATGSTSPKPASSKISPVTPVAATSTTPAAPTTPLTTPKATALTSKRVTIIVKNNQGHSLQNAKVTFDNLSTATTDATGNAIFNNLAPGSHNVIVVYHKQKIARTIDVSAKNDSETVVIKLPAEFSQRLIIFAGGTGILILILIGTILIIMRNRRHGSTPPSAIATPSPSPTTTLNPGSDMAANTGTQPELEPNTINSNVQTNQTGHGQEEQAPDTHIPPNV